MSTLKQVIDKATQVKEITDRIDELQNRKAKLQAELGTLNSTLDERQLTRNGLVSDLRALIAALP